MRISDSVKLYMEMSGGMCANIRNAMNLYADTIKFNAFKLFSLDLKIAILLSTGLLDFYAYSLSFWYFSSPMI